MSSNLADEPSSADGPPTYLTDESSSANGHPHLLVKLVLGRQNFFCQWTPPPTSETSTWQTNLLWPMDTPDTAEMPWMPVHNTWQTNTLCHMDPPVIEQRCLEYWYTQLGRQTYFGWWTPHMVNSNFTLLLTSSCQEWQFHIATDIYLWWMAISHC